jgi:hypothetical protein
MGKKTKKDAARGPTVDINMDTAFRMARLGLKASLEGSRLGQRGAAAGLRELDAFRVKLPRPRGCTHGRSEQFQRQAARILERALGPMDTRVAGCLHILGVHCAATGRYAEAERSHRRAAAIMEWNFGPTNPCVAEPLEHAADACRLMGRHAEASELEGRAERIMAAPSGLWRRVRGAYAAAARRTSLDLTPRRRRALLDRYALGSFSLRRLNAMPTGRLQGLLVAMLNSMPLGRLLEPDGKGKRNAAG